ncbi:MAG: hypothetical protein COA86_18455 [Kangiella sp.]|nr:MAG: hypothetical protein COA86_18455 [Kangiella sp.]
MYHIRLVSYLCLIALIISLNIYFFNHYSLKLVLTHLIIIVSIFSFIAGISIALNALENTKTRLWWRSVIFAIPSTILLFIYIGNALSNYFWKANVNLNLIERMITHFYELYKLETFLLITIIPLISTYLLILFFSKILSNQRLIVTAFKMNSFYHLSFSAFLMIQINTTRIESGHNKLREYFSEEMIFNLFSEYTDAHQDYVARAGGVKDIVSQSSTYIIQSKKTIDYSKKNVVLVIVDCLRADHLKSYGYHRNTTPFINELMSKHSSQQVENAFSICDESKCGIRSILTSRGLGEQNSLEAGENSLHKQLKDNGYQINFLLTSDHAFGGLKRIYSPYDYYLDGIGFNNYPLNDDRGVLSVLEKWPDYNGTPNYFQFHLFSAHEAGITYGKFMGQGVHGIKPGFLKGEPIAPKFESIDPNEQQIRWDRMDNRLFQTDLVFSRIYTLLKDKGYMKNTILILTGDHGQGLGEHGYFGHVKGLHNESLGIPIIMLNTLEQGFKFEETHYGTQFDIAPTILSDLNIAIPNSWDGTALQKSKTESIIITHKIPNRSSSFAKTMYNPTDNSLYKYIFMSTVGGLKEEQFLFDLIVDPNEKNNLLGIDNAEIKFNSLISTWHSDKNN